MQKVVLITWHVCTGYNQECNDHIAYIVVCMTVYQLPSLIIMAGKISIAISPEQNTNCQRGPHNNV